MADHRGLIEPDASPGNMLQLPGQCPGGDVKVGDDGRGMAVNRHNRGTTLLQPEKSLRLTGRIGDLQTKQGHAVGNRRPGS